MPPPDGAEGTELVRRIGSLWIAFDEHVLEPRPWTVAQAEWAAELSPGLPEGRLLELCSGAGHIGLMTALLTGRDAVLVDASTVACGHAERNAAQVAATHVDPSGAVLLQVRDRRQAEQMCRGAATERLAPLEVRDVPGRGSLVHLVPA